MPLAEEALGRMNIGLQELRVSRVKAVKLIHGYGSTGRGAGLNAAGLQRKRDVIKDGLKQHGFVIAEGGLADPEEVFRLLCCVGGLDIAGMTGVFLGGAVYGIPVVIDGVISAVAALAAERMIKGCREYMLPSHQGKEPAMKLLLDALELKAPIHA